MAYQQIAGPMIVAITNGSVEKATGYKINWRQFDSGAKVATAMTSGDVQIGVIGSSPLAAAVSRGVELQLFWILDDINEAEALVVRNGSGIEKPADLKGKKLARALRLDDALPRHVRARALGHQAERGAGHEHAAQPDRRSLGAR